MSEALSPEADDQGAEWARPLYARQIDFLGELSETGMEIARGIAELAKAAEAIEPAQACAMAYARVARAVRISLMLQAKLIKELQAYDRNQAWLTKSDRSQERFEREGLVKERKARLERIVERVADRQHDDADEVERLVEETGERLDQDDVYGDILTRPVSELVAMICKDLGLSPDWPRLAEEAWAREEMERGGEVGWPLTRLTSPELPSPSMGEGPGMGVFAPPTQKGSHEAVSTQPHAPKLDPLVDTPPTLPFPH